MPQTDKEEGNIHVNIIMCSQKIIDNTYQHGLCTVSFSKLRLIEVDCKDCFPGSETWVDWKRLFMDLRQEWKVRDWTVVFQKVFALRRLLQKRLDNGSFQFKWHRTRREWCVNDVCNCRQEKINVVKEMFGWNGVKFTEFRRCFSWEMLKRTDQKRAQNRGKISQWNCQRNLWDLGEKICFWC